MRQPEQGGEKMPSVFGELSAIGADARRGEVLLLVGQPSAGKSLVALWMAVYWVTQHSLRGLYWSADSTVKVAAARAAAMLTGASYFDAERGIESHEDRFLSSLDRLSGQGFEWVFDASIDADSLSLNIDAFIEKWGDTPAWIVIDNLTDLDLRDGDEFGALRAMMRDANYMARETGAAIIVLHHTSEAEKEDPCPPRKAIHGKVSVKPTVILSTARSEESPNSKPIAVVKNRYGVEYKSGRPAFWVPFDANSLQFGHNSLGAKS